MGGYGQAGGIFFYFMLAFMGPALLSRYLLRGTWKEVGIAFLAFYGLLVLVLVVPGGGTYDEKFGWVMIMGMFLGILGVPIATLIQRLFRKKKPPVA
jgi:hypothetical protein